MQQLREFLRRPPHRDKYYWQPYIYAINRLKGEVDPMEIRALAADQFSQCISMVARNWQEGSVRKEATKSLGQEAGLSPTLATRSLIHHLYSSDYLSNYGSELSDDVFNFCLHQFDRFSTESYKIGFNYILSGFAQLGEMFQSYLLTNSFGISSDVIKMMRGYDDLKTYLHRCTESQLKAMPMEFGKMMMWLFGSEGNELTGRDLMLIAAHFNLNTDFNEVTPDVLSIDDVRPLTLLGKTLMREGREPNPKEKASVVAIVDARFNKYK